MNGLSVNSDRMREDFEALARMGATGDGGVNRPSLSPAHLEARAWLRDCIHKAGLGFQIDAAGNHSALLACSEDASPTLLLGSHLDSVPNGGRFDGALGVLAAVEVLRIVKENHHRLPFHLEAIDFTDEEGTLVGELGSTALAGTLSPQSLQSPRGGREALLVGLARAGLVEALILSARRAPASLAGYLELHIEQGLRLSEAEADIGVITSVVGIGSYRVTFLGQAGHAGTTPMEARRDASLAASAFILSSRNAVMDGYPGCVSNVGSVRLFPGAFNIIPERAELSLECRAPALEDLNRLEATLLDLARVEAERFGLALEVERLDRIHPVQMDPMVRSKITRAADDLGLKAIPLPSYAGHDAQAMAAVCPAGMIFVPSVGGISHSPQEFTRWEDCIHGANVLLRTVLRWGRG